MSLRLGQLFYTSFPEMGFHIITSPEVPPEARQAFVQTVTHQLWDAYNPPDNGYRAVYIYQEAPDRTLFGWLYNDGADDRGRSHVPFFIGHYLAGALSPEQLDNIFTLLRKGPSIAIDRQTPPEFLEAAAAPDLWDYKPVRAGVAVPAKAREQAYKALIQGELIEMFVSGDEEYKLDENYLAEFEEEEIDIDDFALDDYYSPSRSSLAKGPWAFLDKLPLKPIAGIAAASLIAAIGVQQIGTVVGPKTSAAPQSTELNDVQKQQQEPFFVGPVNRFREKVANSPDISVETPVAQVVGSTGIGEHTAVISSASNTSAAENLSPAARSPKGVLARHHSEVALEALDRGDFKEFAKHVDEAKAVLSPPNPRAIAQKYEQTAFNALIAGDFYAFKANIDAAWIESPSFHKIASLKAYSYYVEKKGFSNATKLRYLRRKVVRENQQWLSRDQKRAMRYLARKNRFI
ncbi:MAG: hypothetical protein WCA07_10885 [Gloeobacterales cyanobacterium]